jgi:hypothetical protein
MNVSYAAPIEQRFWSRVDKRGADECWPWTGDGYGNGYGGLHVTYRDGILPPGKKRANMGAHRLSYILNKGPVPAGMYVCHTCDNPICVNPAHLFAGTPTDSQIDRRNKGRINSNPRRGEDHPFAKLTEPQVQEIRLLYATGSFTQKDLAIIYHVARPTIKDIVNRQSWTHL